MLIGIMGKAGAGKDTFALILAEKLFEITRKRHVLMSFAHELKLRIQKDFDMSYEQLWDGNEKEKSDLRYAKCLNGLSSNPKDYWTPREILQSYGEFYRSIDSNFWIRHLFEIIDDREYKHVIVTDVRYINEAESVINRNGVLIKIVRNIWTANAVHGQDHISEMELGGYNNIAFTVENNGTLKEIKETAGNIAKELIDRKNR